MFPTQKLPKGFSAWPQSAVRLDPSAVQDLYAKGFAGCLYSPEDKQSHRDATKRQFGSEWLDELAGANNWADSFAGKLVIPFVWVVELFPGCWPGPAQERGDCVSHSDKNTKLGTMCVEIVEGKPDPVTGKVEGKPNVSPEGVANGVLSTEAAYWYRGYDEDGWQCELAAQVTTKAAGAVLRQNYPDLGLDLTKYSGELAGKFGGRKPPEQVGKVLSQHLIRATAQVRTLEAARDALGNGYFLSTCGGEGLETVRDSHGVSRRKGSWSHAMCYIGVDDRESTKKLYGEPLVLDLNSWNKWNSGPRDIVDSAAYVPVDKRDAWQKIDLVNPATGNILIPEGSCWVRYSDMRARSMIAYSSLNGFPPNRLPHLVKSGFG